MHTRNILPAQALEKCKLTRTFNLIQVFLYETWTSFYNYSDERLVSGSGGNNRLHFHGLLNLKKLPFVGRPRLPYVDY